MTLSLAVWKIILSVEWFSGDIMDSYMQLLANEAPCKVSVCSCYFVGTRLFNNQNPDLPVFNFMHSVKEHVWFANSGLPNFDCIIMPLSIKNTHFIIVVIYFRLKVFVISDPLGSDHNAVVHKFVRYLCFKFTSLTGRTFPIEEWKCCKYCLADWSFPLQSDSNNCGPYVCLIAKCIILNRCLRVACAKSLRWTVCQELVSQRLLQ